MWVLTYHCKFLPHIKRRDNKTEHVWYSVLWFAEGYIDWTLYHNYLQVQMYKDYLV